MKQHQNITNGRNIDHIAGCKHAKKPGKVQISIFI